MMRAAIYCRLSDEDRNKKHKNDESESIQNQKSLLLSYCHEKNWEIQGIYCDEDMSGADSSRPEFQKMLAECESHKIDVVVCKTQSRFSRDLEVIEHYIHGKFKEWGVRFIGLLDHADTEDFANKKSRQINGLVNEWYLEDLSENIKKTLRHKKENGIFTGAFAPYGYRLLKDAKGKLFIDETAAQTVRKIYDLYLTGEGYVKIAKELNAEGIPSPARYKKICGSNFKTHDSKTTSEMWSESMIRQILTNPVYKGTLVQRKTETISYKSKKRRTIPQNERIIKENAHEAIVDVATWNVVNQKIGSNERVEKENGKRHIFTGKIFCETCKSSMWKMSYRLKDGRYEYLKCKATKCSDLHCINTASIRFDVVSDLVTREAEKLLCKYYNPEKMINVFKTMPVFHTQQEEKKRIEQSILKQNLNIKQLYKDKLDGIIELREFQDIYQDIKNEILMLEKRVVSIEQNTPLLNDSDVKEFIKKFPKKFRLNAYSVLFMIDRILIGPVIDGTRKITIFWNF